ncbi:MAG: ORF6N domain-containing protein [Candidatus Woesearchaeota archaeon]
MNKIIKSDEIQEKIITIRGVQVILDRDLAYFYEVETKRLNETVHRNKDRFPSDFMFQLTLDEKNELVANCDHLNSLKFSPNLPYVFTEQGVSMLAGLLRSQKAIEVNIEIIRAFVQMRQFFLTNKDTFQRLNVIETKLLEHDTNFNKIFNLLETDKPKTGIFYNNQSFYSS